MLLGEVPGDGEEANVLTISKKGKKEHLGNYRPLSFPSWPRKIMEYILISKHVKNKKTETVSLDLARSNCTCVIAALD